jgi:myo-inositol-1-phosphate synthase
MTAAHIAPAEGRLGVLLPGLGAVSTTLISGIALTRKGLAQPIGSLTQMGTIRLGKRTDNRTPLVREFVPLSSIDDLVFGAWDIFPDNCYQSALKAGVVDPAQLEQVRTELEGVTPWPAAFDPEYVKRLNGPHVKKAANKLALAEQIMADIEGFRRSTGVKRAVMVWCGSTESFLRAEDVHQSLAAFEAGLRANHPAIAPSMLYAYAALQCGIPFANGAPNLTVDIPALLELANARRVPVCGKDFKTGQTLMKTIIAPGLKARMLGLKGWFSTNILGNRDGEVLDEPSAFRTKEESKLSVLDVILREDLYPQLYADYVHRVSIHYYPPRGDNKEGWDNIDVFGWLGYPMQIKINFLCRDSILAAPLVLDLALFLDLAQRAGMHGVQEWLSFYFKSPQTAPGLYPEHDLFIQLMKLKNTLRHLRGEELITHLGLEYYD